MEFCFFFQAEDSIRDAQESRGLGDVYKRQIHDRVNYATTRSFVRVDAKQRIIALELEIDTQFAQVIEYFEIFLSRMTMVRQAVNFLGLSLIHI